MSSPTDRALGTVILSLTTVPLCIVILLIMALLMCPHPQAEHRGLLECKVTSPFNLQVFCNDCSQLVLNVMTHRGLNPHTFDVHCGFDGGQSMLKLALTVTDRLEGEKRGRALYSEVRKIIF